MSKAELMYDPTIYNLTKKRYLSNQDIRVRAYSNTDEILYIEHLQLNMYENREDSCYDVTYKGNGAISFIGRFIDTGCQLDFKYKDGLLLIYESKHNEIVNFLTVFNTKDQTSVVLTSEEIIKLFDIKEGYNIKELNKLNIHKDPERKKRLR